jgi:threonylcarbamoyladenosine tRNA methylthiotransferase MtaB
MSETITKQRASLHTLGCKLNYAETSALAAGFRARGYDVVPFGEESDVIVINSCTVTSGAEKECRQLVRRIHRKSPNSKIVVTGCYAELRPEEIASIDGVALVVGAEEKFDLFDHLNGDYPKIIANKITDEFHGASSLDERTRAFLKIQDGCDYSCSFCTIPKARGASRSAEVDEIVRRAAQLSRDGFHEIILSGVNVGDFGRKSGSSFLQLIQALEDASDVTARIRISSIEPNLLSDEIIAFVSSSSKFCPHFHIPLQSGSASVLRRMQRRYTSDAYRSRVETIKTLMPTAGIGADVIVGFPGETEAEFAETVQFIESLDISYLHVFTYSERPDTRAAEMKDYVPTQARRERNHVLQALSARKKQAFYKSQLGRELTAMLEPNGEGYTENYVRVYAQRARPEIEVARVRLTHLQSEIVSADLLEILAERRESMMLKVLSN